ncbi:STOMAGEN, Epidermal Patterning Factor like-9 [Hibiscus trionum]|uniref:STOMAGEN, Epidermal Patterning Factor like-9 n=1 Tax=Hibiscus trionum TaxID=183268 RepID=A0A9W7HG35_HIBTR|nr:STOMAGEN, Epidermal Patterning Factor like-9 [Hibiscus trionum]
MSNIKQRHLLLLLFFFTLFLSAHLVQGCRAEGSNEAKMKRSWRRLMIGSTAPTCTYNECRGCKSKCSAQQVPVEGNDPINSAYHYKCVCHRS